jgi:hypothetical protein
MRMLVCHTCTTVSSSPRLTRTERLGMGSRKRGAILRQESSWRQKENDSICMEEADGQRAKDCLLCEHKLYSCRAFPQAACIGAMITRVPGAIYPRQSSFDRCARQCSCVLLRCVVSSPCARPPRNTECLTLRLLRPHGFLGLPPSRGS